MAASRKNGGKDCQFQYSSNTPGWWSVITGMNRNHDFLIQITKGKESRDLAEFDVRKTYNSKGGLDANTIKTYSWKVYPKESAK